MFKRVLLRQSGMKVEALQSSRFWCKSITTLLAWFADKRFFGFTKDENFVQLRVWCSAVEPVEITRKTGGLGVPIATAAYIQNLLAIWPTDWRY